MNGGIVVDIAGAHVGGAARYKAELYNYLARTGRSDVRVIGDGRSLSARWLALRESTVLPRGKRVAANNLSFITPGGERWTVLRNALHFLSDSEAFQFRAFLPRSIGWESKAVRFATWRSDVVVTPSTAMAERVIRVLPGVRGRVVVRPHPVSVGLIPRQPRDDAIVCPVLFSPYKAMIDRLAELVAALDGIEPGIRVRVTADSCELPADLAGHPRIERAGRLSVSALARLQARSKAIYFPTGIESFGYPLAEARANGQPVIACDTAHNREIAGPALCGYAAGDPDSLRHAISIAMTREVTPDPGPFDPADYFQWLLGEPS